MCFFVAVFVILLFYSKAYIYCRFFPSTCSMKMKKQQKNLKSPVLLQWCRTVITLEYLTARKVHVFTF